MNIVVFDTETTSIEKPFTYNIGYCIIDTDTGNILVERDFVVEQIWKNIPLFSTAYYAEKRPIYVEAMRKREAVLQKFGYVCRTMRSDFKRFNVQGAYAYNSPFDDRVFEFNCGWFKCINPFDTIPIFDIRGYVHSFMVDNNYMAFCDKHGYYTERGNYSSTAETVYRYMTDSDFVEEHTALSDSKIEAEILLECLKRGAQLNQNYPVKMSIERNITRTLEVQDTAKNVHKFDYQKMAISKDRSKITLW